MRDVLRVALYTKFEITNSYYFLHNSLGDEFRVVTKIGRIDMLPRSPLGLIKRILFHLNVAIGVNREAVFIRCARSLDE